MTDKLVLVIAGSGADAAARLFARPATATPFLEVTALDSTTALNNYVGTNVETTHTESNARKLAVAAHRRAAQRAVQAADHDSADSDSADSASVNPVGVACVLNWPSPKSLNEASVLSPYQTWIAIHTADSTTTASASISEARDQQPEALSAVLRDADLQDAEQHLLDLLYHLLSKSGISVPKNLCLSRNKSKEICDNSEAQQQYTIRHALAPTPFRDLIAGRIVAVDLVKPVKQATWEQTDWRCIDETPVFTSQLIFPGSFNPPHAGHQQMAEIASHEFGKPVICELAVTNAEKHPLDYLSLRERIEWLSERNLAWIVTRTARFYEKADLFPESIFVVGADTAIRIADPKFYGNQIQLRDQALAYFASRGCRFMVFGRATERGFQSSEKLCLPDAMQKISYTVPEHRFRNDISSTMLRAKK